MGSLSLALAALIILGIGQPFPEKYHTQIMAITLSGITAFTIAQESNPKKIYSLLTGQKKKIDKSYEEQKKKFDAISPLSLDTVLKGGTAFCAAMLVYLFLNT